MCVLLLSACEYRGPTLDWGVGQKAKGEEAPQLVPAGFGSSPAFLHAPQMGILGHLALNPTRTQQAGLPHLHHPRQGPSKRIVGGHLITSMNHSQIAPVQPDSGVGGACSGLGAWSWSWELAWVHQPLGALSVWQAGGRLGVWARPPGPSPSYCGFTSPISVQTSPLLLSCLIWVAEARGWSGTDSPRPSRPYLRYLAPASSSRPLQHHGPFLLLFPASSRPCFVCSCLFSLPLPVCLLSLPRALWWWGAGVRPKAQLAPPPAPQLKLELVLPKPEPDLVPAAKVSLLH